MTQLSTLYFNSILYYIILIITYTYNTIKLVIINMH